MDYSPRDLSAMDDEEARQTLTVDQYERREKIIELLEEADETRERFEAEDERATDLVVHADKESLGTEVDLYGNDVLVHLDSDDQALIETIEALDDEFSEVDADEIDALDADDREAFVGLLIDAFDALLVRWNGEDWDDLPEHERRSVLEQAREKWGLDSLFLGLVDVITQVQRDREERADVVDSFRGSERRRSR